MGLWKHLNWHNATHLGIEALKVPFLTKMTKMPLVNPRLTKSQTRSKSSQNNIFHGFTSNPSYLETFVNFDQVWPSLTQGWLSIGPKNPNFHLTAIMCWDKCYCEDYQIFFPKTILGLKSESKQLKYLKNCAKCISTFLEAITFHPTVWFPISLVFWKLDIQSFPRTSRSAQSESRNAFKYTFEAWSNKARTTNVSKGGRQPL